MRDELFEHALPDRVVVVGFCIGALLDLDMLGFHADQSPDTGTRNDPITQRTPLS